MPSSWEDILDNIGDFSAYQLEATPSLAYFSASPFTGNASQAQQQYWRDQYGNVQTQYMGELGSALRSGEQAPSFVDFLSDMPFTERYSSLSPTVRPGSSFRRFAPTTRFLY